jgi:hypothetical protein
MADAGLDAVASNAGGAWYYLFIVYNDPDENPNDGPILSGT